MTYEDAAALLCAVLGSENIKNSIETVASMRQLEVHFHGRTGQLSSDFDTGIRPGHNVVEALAQVLRYFDRENEIIDRIMHKPGFDYADGSKHAFSAYHVSFKASIHVLFEVQYPQHYGFITVGVHKAFKETWTYGRRGAPRNEQIRRVREIALREIAQALRSEPSDETS